MTQSVTMEQLQQLLTQMNIHLGEQIVRSNEQTDTKISRLADIIRESNQETNQSIQETNQSITRLTEQVQDLGVRVDNVTHQVGELVFVLRSQEREEREIPYRDLGEGTQATIPIISEIPASERPSTVYYSAQEDFEESKKSSNS